MVDTPSPSLFKIQDPKSIIYLLYFKISKVRPKQRIYIIESQESAFINNKHWTILKPIGEMISPKCPNFQSLLDLCTHFTAFVSFRD
jgi:hypothetical protein